jgi:perosamine synthetase
MNSTVRKIPVSQPVLDETETRYVMDAVSKGAISGFYGEYLPRFESEFARYCDCQHGVTTTNGTTAIHLALMALKIERGDEVLVSTLTNMATFFAVLYQGAVPVPIDIEDQTWNLDPSLLESKITPRTKAILVVHLFGHPVHMDPVLAVARRHGLYVIEDCAEAHGATYQGRKVGGLGDIGCFSFYANKIITTGEGGMITLNDSLLADRARNLKGLAFGDTNKFMHKDIGVNYRMTNLQAALGCAQFEKIEKIIASKRHIAARYNERFRGLDTLQLPVEMPYARNVYWMYHLVLRGRAADARPVVMQRLAEHGIETREGFIPYNMQEIFIAKGWTSLGDCPKANDVATKGFYLPSGATLTDDEIDHVADTFTAILKTI